MGRWQWEEFCALLHLLSSCLYAGFGKSPGGFIFAHHASWEVGDILLLCELVMHLEFLSGAMPPWADRCGRKY